MPLQPLKFAAFALSFLAHFLWVFLSMWRGHKAEFCWWGLGGCLCVQVVGNDQRTSRDPVEKWDLVRKNSACSINKFQNKFSLFI